VDLAILPSRAAGLSVEERVSLTQAGTPALGAAGSLDAASPLVVETGGTFATGGKSQAFPAERSP